MGTAGTLLTNARRAARTPCLPEKSTRGVARENLEYTIPVSTLVNRMDTKHWEQSLKRKVLLQNSTEALARPHLDRDHHLRHVTLRVIAPIANTGAATDTR